MKYEVISPFNIRERGKPTGKYSKIGDEVELNAREGKRLIQANCVLKIETGMRRQTETR